MILKGEDSIFFIKYNGEWFPIACETSNSLSESAEMMNTTTRDNEGWKTEIPGMQSYSISLEAMLKIDIENEDLILSYSKLRNIKRARQLIEWKRETLKGRYIDNGKAYIIEISDSNSVGEDISFSLTLNGFGKPESDEKTLLIGDFDEILTDNNNIALWST